MAAAHFELEVTENLSIFHISLSIASTGASSSCAPRMKLSLVAFDVVKYSVVLAELSGISPDPSRPIRGSIRQRSEHAACVPGTCSEKQSSAFPLGPWGPGKEGGGMMLMPT